MKTQRFRPVRIFSLSLLMIVLIFASHPLQAAEALNYRYTVDEEKPLNYWFDKQGIRMDLEDGDQKFTILYRSDENSLAYLLHHEEKAIVLDEQFLETMIAQIKRMRRKLKKLPERQRKMLERSMGETMRGLKKDQAITTPTFVPGKKTEWRGRAAVRHDLVMDGDTAGRALFLEEPPVEFTPGEQSSVDGFQSIMKKMMKVTGTMAESLGDVRINQNRSFHLLGDRLFRLAAFQSSENRIVLSDWNREEISDDHFTIPENYTVQKPGSSPDGSGLVPGQ